MNLELHNDQIKSILESYKKKRQREILNYHTNIKNNPELMEKRRETARQHYNNNKEKKKEYYEKNKEHIRLQRLATYYKDDLSKLKTKYPMDYEVMVDLQIIQSSSDSQQ